MAPPSAAPGTLSWQAFFGFDARVKAHAAMRQIGGHLGMRWLNAIAALALWSAPALAEGELLTEKKVFELPSYTTAGGATIKGVRVGWESYGTLNADRSNAILVTHFFSGTSHAAGKYAPGDKAPGYWDAIIGPGKAIDTN
jgi:homoserine O-acetyltransferase